MGKDHRGHPTGVNKSGNDTGVPAGKFVDDPVRDQELTEKYTDDEANVADNVRQKHPNRNTDKDNATNAGGYKGGTS